MTKVERFLYGWDAATEYGRQLFRWDRASKIQGTKKAKIRGNTRTNARNEAASVAVDPGNVGTARRFGSASHEARVESGDNQVHLLSERYYNGTQDTLRGIRGGTSPSGVDPVQAGESALRSIAEGLKSGRPLKSLTKHDSETVLKAAAESGDPELFRQIVPARVADLKASLGSAKDDFALQEMLKELCELSYLSNGAKGVRASLQVAARNKPEGRLNADMVGEIVQAVRVRYSLKPDDSRSLREYADDHHQVDLDNDYYEYVPNPNDIYNPHSGDW